MRVSGGSLRGRRLHAAPGSETRPTTGRARSGLFDWLGDRLSEGVVLDLFAGSGALGIEALSRGACDVVFVERSPRAQRALRKNLRELGIGDRARLIADAVAPAISRLRREGQRFDLVLADPPYGGGQRWALAKAGHLVDILAPEAVVLLERDRREAPAGGHPGLVRLTSRTYGETAFDWYERMRHIERRE